jgi:hypothetical protein
MAGAFGAFLLLPLLGAKNRKTRRRRLMLSSVLLFATLASVGMMGCGSGPTTSTGTYAIQINATSGTLSERTVYTLTVQ